jgi:TonB family protein
MGTQKNQILNKQTTLIPLIIILFTLFSACASKSKLTGTGSFVGKSTPQNKMARVSINDSTVLPIFPGGDNALIAYISNNLKYPLSAAQAKIEGRVVIRFIVDTDGKTSDFYIVNSVNKALDEEAIRVISEMPKWIPGTINGRTANIHYTIPIVYKLQR